MTKPKGYFVIKVTDKFVSSFSSGKYELTNNDTQAMRFYDQLERMDLCCDLLLNSYSKKDISIFVKVVRA